MQRGLASLGHHVEVAFDAMTALELARQWQPAIAVLDIAMPGMDGYALARELRVLGVTRFIASTGTSDVARSRVAGFERHLMKPIDLHELDRALREPAAVDDIERAFAAEARELHHRVVNSFGLIDSLLQLQARGADPATRSALELASHRVHAIAAAHRDGSPTIELGGYIDRIVRGLVATPTVSWKPCLVDLRLAIPLGLVITQLLVAAHDGEVVRDELLATLLAQLRAELTLDGGPGTRARVRIPR